MNKHTILFLAASPLGSVRLALEQEARAIHMELEQSGNRDRFALVTRWAAQPLDLLRELRKLKPTVVHFSGHGSRAEPGDAWRKHSMSRAGLFDQRHDGLLDNDRAPGLFFQGLDGRPQLVSTEALEETFGAAGASVKVVVLNACYSEMQAEALSAQIDYIVGISGSIGDDAARNFAVGFYGGIGEHESIAAAYRQGRAAISLQSLPDDKKPQLYVRNGLDAEKFILADISPENVTTALNSLRFSAIAIDKRDKNWHKYGYHHAPETWPFKQRASLHFAKETEGGDPLFDITLVSVLDTPVIITAVGIEISRVASRYILASPPKASRIFKLGSYVIDIPNIKLLYDTDHSSVDIYDTICKELSDPIYLEPRAPYRYGLRLRHYSKHMPTLARIRIVVTTDRGSCHSDEIEMYQEH